MHDKIEFPSLNIFMCHTHSIKNAKMICTHDYLGLTHFAHVKHDEISHFYYAKYTNDKIENLCQK